MTDPAAPAPEVVDLMEALRLSLVRAKERREAKTAAPAPEVDTACGCCGLPPGDCCEVDYDDDHPDTIYGAQPGTRYGA